MLSTARRAQSRLAWCRRRVQIRYRPGSAAARKAARTVDNLIRITIEAIVGSFADAAELAVLRPR